MKNIVLTLSVLFLSVTFFASCDKAEDVETGTNPTALVKGVVQAELDLTSEGLEPVPAGTKIFFRINAEDLVCNIQEGYVYQILQFSTVVGEGGAYAISLPTSCNNDVIVNIQADQFMAQQQITSDTFTERVFFAAEVPLGTRADQTYFFNINY